MNMRRICVFGAGAIGGHLAAKFAAAGLDVSVVARGASLAAIKANGIALREGAPRRPGGTGTAGAQGATATAHKPSMLQDYERGRPMEVDAILAVPCAFARAVGVAAPTLEAVHAVTARLAARKGLYSAP